MNLFPGIRVVENKEVDPAKCRQCGKEVPQERRQWATPICFECLPRVERKAGGK